MGLLRGDFWRSKGVRALRCVIPSPISREDAAALVNRTYAAHTRSDTYRGCVAYEDFRHLLDDPGIDAVVILAPNHLACPIALAAVRAGKDVYVETSGHQPSPRTRRCVLPSTGMAASSNTEPGDAVFSTHCAFACELVRDGPPRNAPRNSHAGSGGFRRRMCLIPRAPSPGFNYNLSPTGPAPNTLHGELAPPISEHTIATINSLGFLAGWGAHPLDVMH